MNYYAIDVETSGLDPKESSILSIGAVDIETGDTFYEECQAWEGAYISETALKINGFSQEDIHDESKLTEALMIINFFDWLREHPMMIAQNASFDRDFIDAAAQRAGVKNPFSFRTIDIHAIVQVEMLKVKWKVPAVLSLNACLKYFHLGAEPTPHNALTGAKCNAAIFNRIVYNKH